MARRTADAASRRADRYRSRAARSDPPPPDLGDLACSWWLAFGAGRIVAGDRRIAQGSGMSMSGLSGRRILVSGGGLAGPAVASLLARAGGEVTVVEIADRVRLGGQAVDIRGAGRTVLRRIGLLDRVRAVSLHQRGIADVDARHLLRSPRLRQRRRRGGVPVLVVLHRGPPPAGHRGAHARLPRRPRRGRRRVPEQGLLRLTPPPRPSVSGPPGRAPAARRCAR
jgi:NADPH-dependent 2,4-dienoyl-CoA reductase/sulfur reductase-like enzyme